MFGSGGLSRSWAHISRSASSIRTSFSYRSIVAIAASVAELMTKSLKDRPPSLAARSINSLVEAGNRASNLAFDDALSETFVVSAMTLPWELTFSSEPLIVRIYAVQIQEWSYHCSISHKAETGHRGNDALKPVKDLAAIEILKLCKPDVQLAAKP